MPGAGAKRWSWRQDLARLSFNPGDWRQAGGECKDRIGTGPWTNAKGVVIAKDLQELHSPTYKINKTTALTEKGEVVPGRGDTPNEHDALTGSQQDGTVVPGTDDATCSNWTSSVDGQGSAVVGHTDLVGNSAGVNFWNYSHKTPGCAPANLQRVGGAGRFYCFATN